MNRGAPEDANAIRRLLTELRGWPPLRWGATCPLCHETHLGVHDWCDAEMHAVMDAEMDRA